MKMRYLYSFVIALASLAFTACDSDDNDGEAKIPDGALPSTEMTLGNLDEQAFEDDVVYLINRNGTSPFYSLELLADGHYLLCTSQQSGVLYERVKTRAVGDATTQIGGNYEYGTYQKSSDDGNVYTLSNGCQIDITGVIGGEKMTYTNSDGSHSVVYVKAEKPQKNVVDKSLCRTWNCNSFEAWMYLNGAYMAHGKQEMVNGSVNTSFKAAPGSGLESDDMFDEEDGFCYRVIFSPAGTYVCFYTNGEAEVSYWRWASFSEGTLYYYDPTDDDSDKDDGYVTVRFAGKQMRVYEDVNYDEDGYSFREVAVNTFTAL